MLAVEHWKAVEDLYQAPAHASLVEDSEFDYVTSEAPDRLVQRLSSAVLWGLIGRVPSGVELPRDRELGPSHVAAIVAELRLLLVGAWDADGYVFWEPAQTD